MRTAAVLFFLGASCVHAQSAPAQSAPALAKEYIPKLERNLKENIIPFWLKRTIDRVHGGYVLNHNAAGEANPKGSKGIVTQSRQVWFFSKLAREGYQPKESLEAAAHGFRFLRDVMWDKQHGGFYWEVDATGKERIRPKKHMYAQSFALYALSEYYLASKEKASLDLANRLFGLLETKAHDGKYGGYLEYFNEDWSMPPAGETGYMSVGPELKLMNTHLHLLEALTAYYRASKSPVARERLVELINIESNAVVRKGLVACTDKYDRNWKPRLDNKWDRVSYGHDVENVWLLIDAIDAIGNSSYPLVDLFRDLWAYTLKYGYDEQNGGLYDSGNFNQPADSRQKAWWVQAEAIVSALYMYRYTQDEKYLDIFRQTYDFIDKYQVDWKVGEWHSTVSTDNEPRGGKANIWKGGYHNGRAMLECLTLLRALQ
jgi:mannobiose 2-epimerase